MASNFHESFSQAEVKPPSERSTGLVFAGVAGLLAVLWRETPWALWGFSSIAVALIAISLRVPHLLRPLNYIWFQIGLLLHRVVSPLVMFIDLCHCIRSRRSVDAHLARSLEVDASEKCINLLDRAGQNGA